MSVDLTVGGSLWKRVKSGRLQMSRVETVIHLSVFRHHLVWTYPLWACWAQVPSSSLSCWHTGYRVYCPAGAGSIHSVLLVQQMRLSSLPIWYLNKCLSLRPQRRKSKEVRAHPQSSGDRDSQHTGWGPSSTEGPLPRQGHERCLLFWWERLKCEFQKNFLVICILNSTNYCFLPPPFLKQDRAKNLLEKHDDFELPSNPTNTVFIISINGHVNIKVTFMFRDTWFSCCDFVSLIEAMKLYVVLFARIFTYPEAMSQETDRTCKVLWTVLIQSKSEREDHLVTLNNIKRAKKRENVLPYESPRIRFWFLTSQCIVTVPTK